MISRSKISVNVMPWFKQGAHDRVFNSMLNGAVCVTDTSGYLKDNFIDGENIIFYNLENIDAAADKIKRLLTNHDDWNILQKMHIRYVQKIINGKCVQIK